MQTIAKATSHGIRLRMFPPQATDTTVERPATSSSSTTKHRAWGVTTTLFPFWRTLLDAPRIGTARAIRV
jgi:hypothetical protein